MTRTLAVALLVWAAALPSARAQCEPEPEPAASMRSIARGHYNAGIEAAEAERWGQAREAFQRAYDVAPFAQIVFNLATAQSRVGYLVESAETYRRFLRRCASEGMPDLRRDAESFLAELTPRLGRLSLRIDNLDTSVDRVTVDGSDVSAALGSEIPINPGSHQVRVVREEEGEVLTHTFDVREGRATIVELSVPPPLPRRGDGGDGGGDGGGGDGGGDRAAGDDTGLIVGLTVALVAVLGAGVGVLVFVLTTPGDTLPPGTWEPVQLPLLRF